MTETEKLQLISSIDKPIGMSTEQELAWALKRVMDWHYPHGTNYDEYIPRWLKDLTDHALGRYLK